MLDTHGLDQREAGAGAGAGASSSGKDKMKKKKEGEYAYCSSAENGDSRVRGDQVFRRPEGLGLASLLPPLRAADRGVSKS